MLFKYTPSSSTRSFTIPKYFTYYPREEKIKGEIKKPIPPELPVITPTETIEELQSEFTNVIRNKEQEIEYLKNELASVQRQQELTLQELEETRRLLYRKTGETV